MTKASCSRMTRIFSPCRPDKYWTFTNKHGTGYEDLTEARLRRPTSGTVMRTLRFTRALSAVAADPIEMLLISAKVSCSMAVSSIAPLAKSFILLLLPGLDTQQ